MEQEKPFKTIEVIDIDTKQLCKVACMSCIRGHRTTSCGIPVCRTKIFWTVKRPGRPSNSCTCRFHSSGVCKCVTAIPKCPHKSKKGEKRSSECRCDEQGRFCCLLEPNHWNTLMALDKPIVQFFPNRDALEAWQASQSAMASPQSTVPSFFEPAPTPQRQGSCCGSTTTMSTPHISRSIASSPSEAVVSPSSSISMPGYSFVNMGAPVRPSHETAEAMAWNGLAPAQPQYQTPEAEEVVSSCCGGSSAYTPPPSQDYQTYQEYQPYTPAPPAGFDFDRWNQNYQLYQYPNAICQHCGLNGCTCRSCPPLMQNFGTTSWAHSCGRRHARIAPMPAARAPQQVLQPHVNGVTYAQAPSMVQHVPNDAPGMPSSLPPMQQVLAQTRSPELQAQAHTPPSLIQQDSNTSPGHYGQHVPPHIQHTQPPHLQSIPIHTLHPPPNGYDDHMMSMDPPDHLDYNDFVIPELARPQHIVDEHMYGG